MPAYNIAPWIGQPADPAAHYQAGFQIGVHLGAQQAAQAFQQQQMAMQERRQLMAQQEQEVQNQMQAQVLNLKASEAARQHQANQIYAARVAQGEDPSRVLMELAPELGESPEKILHDQAMVDVARARVGLQRANMLKPNVEEQEIAAQLRDEEATAVSSGGKAWTDAERVKRRAELRGMKSFKPSLEGSLTWDEQGRPIINLGQGKIQPGAQAAIQQELAALKNNIVQIQNTRNNLREKDLGIAGSIWDRVVNKYVAQFVPGAADPSVSGNRLELQKAADTYLMAMQQRGRLTGAEREDIREGLAGRGLGEALPRAQRILDSMAKVQRLEAIARAKTAQQPLQDWMFSDLTQMDIRQLLREGVLSSPEAKEWAAKAKLLDIVR